MTALSAGGNNGAPRTARRRHYVNPTADQGGIAPLEAVQPPPLMSAPPPPADGAPPNPAATVAAAAPLPTEEVSAEVVAALLQTAMDRVLGSVDARRAEDVRRRLQPLHDALMADSITASARTQIASLINALDKGDTEGAHARQVQLVLHYGSEVGTAAVALKKLVQLAGTA